MHDGATQSAATLQAEVCELLNLHNGHHQPQVSVRARELPDSVVACVVCPTGPDVLLLVDLDKPDACQHALILIEQFSAPGALAG